jgi:hypothetical protein
MNSEQPKEKPTTVMLSCCIKEETLDKFLETGKLEVKDLRTVEKLSRNLKYATETNSDLCIRFVTKTRQIYVNDDDSISFTATTATIKLPPKGMRLIFTNNME